MSRSLVFLGLSITSSWGNGHATTYRSLLRELARMGHTVTFLERDLPFYAASRDMPSTPFCTTHLYASLDELKQRFARTVREADVVVVGSYVPQGIAVGDWIAEEARGITAFYDIDTPITVRDLERGDCEYLAARQVPSYDLYLSFTGGPTLRRIERDFGSPCARALYCGVDPEVYFPENAATLWDMGYLGTYSPDRQAALERLLLEPARTWPAGRFIVAGAQYPQEVRWPGNVEHVAHLAPAQHRSFYSAQRYTLNVTRADMVRAGFSPSVRFFEAAACGTPILTDYWSGLEEFFEPGKEIAIVSSAAEALAWLHQANDEPRHRMGERARARALREHTAQSRAETLLRHLDAANATRRRRKPTEGPFRMANQRGVS